MNAKISSVSWAGSILVYRCRGKIDGFLLAVASRDLLQV
jgi:hypothetical protein